jgi:hypothetical protein
VPRIKIEYLDFLRDHLQAPQSKCFCSISVPGIEIRYLEFPRDWVSYNVRGFALFEFGPISREISYNFKRYVCGLEFQSLFQSDFALKIPLFDFRRAMLRSQSK